jgi:hypothetical protein
VVSLVHFRFDLKILKERTNDKIEINKESLKNAQQDKTENDAGSVLLSLFMDGNGNFKLPSTPSSTGLSRIQHLIMEMVKF